MIVRTELDDNAIGGSHRVHVRDLIRNAALAYYGGSTSDPRYVAFQLAGINAGIDH